MAGLDLSPAILDTVEEANVGSEVVISGSGFLANAAVKIEITGRSGSFAAEILSDSVGNFSSTGSQTRASGTLTSTGVQITEDDAVTIDDKTYTFKSEITVESAENEVLIGEFASDTLANLKAAVNLGDGQGILYSEVTTAHSTVEAMALTVMNLQLVAKVNGPLGNDIATTTTADELSFSGDTLLGGLEANDQKYIEFRPPYDGLWTIRASDALNSANSELRVWRST